MARFFADENYPFEVVLALRELGHDVITIQETGHSNLRIDDLNVLAIATRDQRILLSEDRDFRRLHRECDRHSGIVHSTHDRDARALAHRIHDALDGRLVLDGLLIRIYRPNNPASGHGRGKKRKRK